jgi:hypothetical protein
MQLFRQRICSPNPISYTRSAGIPQNRYPRTRYNHYRRNPWRQLRRPRRETGETARFWKAR